MSKITVNARPFNLKLKYPFGISRGTIDYAKNILITLNFGDFYGFGESAPSLYYGEDQDHAIKFINAFIKYKSLEEYLTNIQKLKEDLDSFSLKIFDSSCPSAKVALEMAFWDLMGKINNKCMYQFIFKDDPFLSTTGNEYKNLPATSYTIGLDKLFVIEEKVKYALKVGYRFLKIKLGLGYEEDLSILKTVQSLVKDHSCVLRVDANGGWDLETTKKMLDILPKYKVELLEQPLRKGQMHLLSQVTNNTSIPIFVDEDCMVSRDVESIAGKAHGINVKLMKAGSIFEAINMINLAKAYNLKIMLGCMIESSCSISAAVHLSPLADFADLDGHLLLEHDPFSGLYVKNNKIIPSFEPGLGVELTSS